MKTLSLEIVNWLKQYAGNANRNAFVVGVSGGVDSALVSTLCAMTGLPTTCVVLPCHSKADETARGERHVDWLIKNYGNIAFSKIDLTKTFDSFKDEVSSNLDNKLAYANTKSRLRMISLYQIATVNNGLVVGTGNKVEDYGVGFFTKYGDGGVDISPIGDLTKTEVRQMCRVLEILPELSEAIPTDGLWDDGRTDESQLGASYNELEWAMAFRETNYQSLYFLSTMNTLTTRQLEVLTSYDRWHDSGKHKLNPIPVFKRKINA